MAFLIDFHTHFFSRTFFQALAKASPISDDPDASMERVANSAGLELPSESDDEHLQLWLREADRHGVSHFVSFASAPEEIPVLSKMAESAQGRLIPFAVIDPTAPDCSEQLDDLLESKKFRGAVLFPAMHNYSIDGPEAARIFRTLDKHRAVAVVHCGMLNVPLRDRFGLPRNYNLTLANPLHLISVADRYADVQFVIPHFGAGFFRETLMAGSQCERVYVDTSSSNTWREVQTTPLDLADVFDRTLGVFGSDRILFGTDSCVFPRGWRHDVFLAQREALGACGLTAAEKAKILGENAAHLLRIRSQSEAVQSPI